MTTLTEIEAAAKSLPPQEQEMLLRHLAEHVCSLDSGSRVARALRRDGDLLLEAPADAPAMTPDRVRCLLEKWP